MMSADLVAEGFARAVRRREAALFVGSGVSIPSGAPSWYELLKRYENDLEITIDANEDLPQIAQYVVNANLGNRGALVASIKDLTARSTGPNDIHRSMTLIPVDVIWTTNYDTLIEEAFGDSVLVRVDDSDIATVNRSPRHQTELIKIHGCRVRSKPGDMVVTSGDYEDLGYNRPALVQRLRQDMMHRSLLFIGYSFNDPDTRTAMTQARRLVGGDTREHYLVTKRATGEDAHRQDLWVCELRRLGIRCALIDDYDELIPLMQSIVAKARGRTIFPTGSHTASDTEFAADLGAALAEMSPEVRLLDGQSEGYGRAVIQAFSMSVIHAKQDLQDRIELHANPYAYDPRLSNDPRMLDKLISLRKPLLKGCNVLVAFDGGMGTNAEVNAALNLGCVVLPVPLEANGSARQLLNESRVRRRLDQFTSGYAESALSGKPTVDLICTAIAEAFER